MFKYIVDENIELKLLTKRDKETLFHVVDHNREHLRQWQPWVDKTQKLEDIERFIQFSMDRYIKDRGFNAGIWYDKELVGIIGLNDFDSTHKNSGIGYWLAEDYQGKGIMTKCCTAIIDYLIKDLQFERVEIRCAEFNMKSQAIPKRLGFTEEGMIRRVENIYGTYVNHKIFGLLKDEWQQL